MPEATVAAIITTPDKEKILLTRRGFDPYKDKWCLPGGHIDWCETAKDAIIREVKEETGLDFTSRFFGYFDEIIPENNIHAVVIVFEGHGAGVLTAQSGEVTDVGWFPLVEAQSSVQAFMHDKILEAYVSQAEGEGSAMENHLHQVIGPEEKQRRTEMLAEFSALRAEIASGIRMRNQVMTFTLVAAGTFLTLGVQESVTGLVLLTYPILALFLSLAWTRIDLRIGELGEYIRDELETKLALNWQHHLERIHADLSKRSPFRIAEVVAAGIFLFSECIAMVLAVPKLTSSMEEIVLLFVDALAIVLTIVSLARRRRRMFKYRPGAN